MTDLLIRNVPPTLAASISEAAQGEGLNREQLLRRLLDERFGEPQTMLAFIRADRPGEVDYRFCPECGQDMTALWFAVTSARTLVGPVCAGCAVTGE